MTNEVNKIYLNEILNLENLDNVKIRFNLMVDDNWNPIEIFKNDDTETLLRGHYWNYKKQKSYKNGQITIGLILLNRSSNLWLLFHIGRITKDLNILDDMGYEYETLTTYEKYFGRIIVKFKNKHQNMIRNANSVINDCEIEQILPNVFNNDIFPGYENVNINWEELSQIISKANWKTALQNQKGVYLITDTSNGKMYVGSAYGENMILGRWKAYKDTCHGGNIGLKNLPKEHIKKHFRYSILDIFKSTIDDKVIISRENWWKNILQSRRFGYNEN